LDGIIAPSFSSPALDPRYVDPLSMTACYTFIWNIYNLPVGILPITLVEKNEEHFRNS
jgi:hypothetical protein